MGKAGHDGDQQLTFGIQGVDIFFLEIYLHTLFLQFPHGGKAVNGVSCETAHALGHNKINLSRQSILDHLIKAVPIFCHNTRNAFIRVHIHKCPLWVAANVLGVVIHLGFITGKLLVLIRGHTGITCHSAQPLGAGRDLRVPVQSGRNNRYVLMHMRHSFPLLCVVQHLAFPMSNFLTGICPANGSSVPYRL